MNLLEQLKKSDIFKNELVFKRNEFIKYHNTIDSSIYFIKSGSVKISILSEDKEQIIRFGYEGDLIVALDSFINNQKSEFLIQTIKKSEVLVAEKKDFTNWVYSNSENAIFYIKLLEDLVLQQIEREKDLLIESPKERFQKVLKRNPSLFQKIPHKHIANYLRMSSETLSRLKKTLI